MVVVMMTTTITMTKIEEGIFQEIKNNTEIQLNTKYKIMAMEA